MLIQFKVKRELENAITEVFSTYINYVKRQRKSKEFVQMHASIGDDILK